MLGTPAHRVNRWVAFDLFGQNASKLTDFRIPPVRRDPTAISLWAGAAYEVDGPPSLRGGPVSAAFIHGTSAGRAGAAYDEAHETGDMIVLMNKWVFSFLAAASMLWAQSGTIQGVVKDPSEAVVAGASVVLTNLDTGLRRELSTNDQGFFTAPTLPVGRYKISAAKAGF